MKLVFLSNYLNHHQLPFCLEMYKRLGADFTFVATAAVSESRLALGYADLDHAYPFVICAYDGPEQQQAACDVTDRADVVIIGSAPMSFVKARLKRRKLTFLYSERLYKQQPSWWKRIRSMLRTQYKYGMGSSMYLLCASAYSAGDYAKNLTFKNKTYKWGYFPQVNRYEPDGLMDRKENALILWAGRMINWKHPDSVVQVAYRLKQAGYSFRVQMLGTGEMEQQLQEQIRELGLEDCVTMPGAMPPEQVRELMEQAAIYLFTSDRNEGWGAVLNESMNSGCAVVASDAIGAAPFLIKDGKNGRVYESENTDDLYEKVKYLLDNPQIREAMGRNAYETMVGMWNAETAAERLLALSRALADGQQYPRLYADGPCSKAEILRNKHA